jgi:hypothetical protein
MGILDAQTFILVQIMCHFASSFFKIMFKCKTLLYLTLIDNPQATLPIRKNIIVLQINSL